MEMVRNRDRTARTYNERVAREVEVLIADLLLPWTVDLADYDTINNPSLREHIDRVGIAIYP